MISTQTVCRSLAASLLLAGLAISVAAAQSELPLEQADEQGQEAQEIIAECVEARGDPGDEDRGVGACVSELMRARGHGEEEAEAAGQEAQDLVDQCADQRGEPGEEDRGLGECVSEMMRARDHGSPDAHDQSGPGRPDSTGRPDEPGPPSDRGGGRP